MADYRVCEPLYDTLSHSNHYETEATGAAPEGFNSRPRDVLA